MVYALYQMYALTAQFSRRIEYLMTSYELIHDCDEDGKVRRRYSATDAAGNKTSA